MYLKNKDDVINGEFESMIENNNLSECQSIPKTIHMFWFGGAEKSDIIKMSINSWRVYAPLDNLIDEGKETIHFSYS